MVYKNSTNRPAFSMLELVFVITILGIVASLGSEIIAKVYQSYIIQRATHRSSIKTELAALQIANRLAYVIPNTAIGRKSSDSTFESLDALTTNDYDILEWVGYDIDSFKSFMPAEIVPGWSGFIDLNAPNTRDRIITPGSNLRVTTDVIKFLSKIGDEYKTLANTAIFFPGEYTPLTIGYNGNISGVSRVAERLSNTSLRLEVRVPDRPRTIKEFYKLAWSAYAIVPIVQPDNGLWEIRLFYDLQPWNGIDYNSAGARSQTLLRNVSVFQFSGTENSIRFKLCQQELIGAANPITTCKEKAIIR